MKNTKITACFKKQLRNKTSEIFGKNKKQDWFSFSLVSYKKYCMYVKINMKGLIVKKSAMAVCRHKIFRQEEKSQ